MTDRLRIFNRSGALLSEFTTSAARAWLIGNRSDASFTVSTTDAFCTETVFNFGNWVIIESDRLPTWCGTIATREWGRGKLTVSARSPEFLFSQRIGNNSRIVNGSAGTIFSEIINEVNTKENTLVRSGTLYHSQARQETINPTQLDKDLTRIYTRSGEEYSWRVDFGSYGNLIIYGDWSRQLGNSLNFTLYESNGGGNIEASSRSLLEDAPIANYVFGYGNGLTWATKPVAAVVDSASVNKYGLIQKSSNYYGVSRRSTVEAAAAAEVAKTKNPSSVISVNAYDNGDTFPSLALGNVMSLKMQSIGFSNGMIGVDRRVRIIGMFYDPAKGEVVELALDLKE